MNKACSTEKPGRVTEERPCAPSLAWGHDFTFLPGVRVPQGSCSLWGFQVVLSHVHCEGLGLTPHSQLHPQGPELLFSVGLELPGLGLGLRWCVCIAGAVTSISLWFLEQL